MATLTQLTLDADGTIDTVNIEHDAGIGSPYVGHCNDAPDGVSGDWVGNDTGEKTGTAWFSLSDVDSDFGSMDGLNIDVDVDATSFSDDTCALTARIFAADNDVTNPLTNESGNLGTEADTTRAQRNVVFGGLTGSKAQWNAAHIRFTWTYVKTGAGDNGQVRLFGCDIDGTYTIQAAITVDMWYRPPSEPVLVKGRAQIESTTIDAFFGTPPIPPEENRLIGMVYSMSPSRIG